ncbi:MAG TPA: undecaprenyldiphospho-muramoylpentapeptide beta-N-acetylglucosaminyltransferase [Arcobacter sp.]|nr:undecaprenyldiphospho-muramoylpentapeptide beta-N-acetylglucosaminyltransferase [Arcobacter sp.]HIP55957.1 undecaprenyldiphospho-muramoylpentapeptide beta-N-acetylglucosaminyltransferase [Arcobacter sp.]
MKNNYVVVTGGGTGGHLSVAKSLIYEFYKRGYHIIFIGSTKGADKSWFKDEEKIEKAYFLDTKGVVNQGFIGKIKSMAMIFKAMVFCLKIFNTYKVKKVVSVGGFSAAPASFASSFFRCDFYIHEQNSVMGKLNQITSKIAKEVFSSYDKNSPIKDYPINQDFFKHSRIREDIKTIIFLGGSQGASAINNFALQIAPILKEKNINIIHQTGKNDFIKIRDTYKNLNINAEVFDFSTDILSYMNKADFAISRSGASTLWELSALGMPTLYIPYPYAAANHQYYNAKFLLDDKLCLVKKQDELNETIVEDILKLDMRTISTNLLSTISQNGVEKIVDKIIL